MNSASELLERLLKLYPVKILKGQFDVEGSTQAEKLPQIATKYSADVIKQFAIDKIGHTKQHTYIFKLGTKFSRKALDISKMPVKISSEFHGDDGNYVFFCFPIVEYDVALLNPYQEFTVQFYQPTRIVVKNKILIIQTTIMERSASAYLPVDKKRKLVDIEKRNTEEVFIPKILAEFRKHSTVELCDLNKGVKAMWAANTIDATTVRYKKDKSTATESMDEQFTVKADMPDTYKDIVTRPLNKMAFRPLKEEDHFSRSFTVDPSKGEFSMNIYPEDPDQTWNIINEILRNN